MNSLIEDEGLELLKSLIAIPSISKEENQTADLIEGFFLMHNLRPKRSGNNIWAVNRFFDESKPTILLNSHHDTVKPNSGYTRNPFSADIEDDRLYGLGSNDAGGCLVSLISAFRFFYNDENLKYNLCVAATAEEEISGKNGIESILPQLGKLDFAIVGEPTLMNLAIAEKGLIVLDCISLGKAGHAAREDGDNAIYRAMQDIEWFRTYTFPKISNMFGPVKMSVTMINAGLQHNIVPAQCEFTVDIRVTDVYRNDEIIDIIKKHVKSDLKARSTRLKPSSISVDHPFVLAAVSLGCKTYGSPTTSDQALLDIPSVKIGPGDSARSHIANEYIYISEIKTGIKKYVDILEKIIK